MLHFTMVFFQSPVLQIGYLLYLISHSINFWRRLFYDKFDVGMKEHHSPPYFTLTMPLTCLLLCPLLSICLWILFFTLYLLLFVEYLYGKVWIKANSMSHYIPIDQDICICPHCISVMKYEVEDGVGGLKYELWNEHNWFRCGN